MPINTVIHPQVTSALLRLNDLARVVLDRLLGFSSIPVRCLRYVCRRILAMSGNGFNPFRGVKPSVDVPDLPDNGAGDGDVGRTGSTKASGLSSPRAQHRVYADRDFLLYLKELPYCKKFQPHLFVDPDLPFIRRDSPSRGGMMRDELERTTRQVMDAVYKQNIVESINQLNSLRLSDSCDTTVVANIIFEKAMENPKLIAQMCPHLHQCVFDAILEQSAVEIEFDHGLEKLRRSVSTKLDRFNTTTYSPAEQQMINDLLQKERSLKRRFAAAALFVAELYSLGAPVRVKLIFTVVYKLLNLWISKREELFIETLCSVLNSVLWKMEERGNAQYRVMSMVKQLEELSTNPSTPERMRFLLGEALASMTTRTPPHLRRQVLMSNSHGAPAIPAMPASPFVNGIHYPVGCYYQGPCCYSPNATQPCLSARAAADYAAYYSQAQANFTNRYLLHRQPLPYATSFVPPPPPLNYCHLLIGSGNIGVGVMGTRDRCGRVSRPLLIEDPNTLKAVEKGGGGKPEEKPGANPGGPFADLFKNPKETAKGEAQEKTAATKRRNSM